MSVRLLRGTLSFLLCLTLFAGCSRSPKGPETVEVTGTVTFDGTPIEGANVIFHPVENGDQSLSSQSITDKEGRFELSTFVGGSKFKPGIAPGRYAVAVTKLDTASVSTTLAPPKNLLPRKYANPKTSGQTADVALGRENNFEFALNRN